MLLAPTGAMDGHTVVPGRALAGGKDMHLPAAGRESFGQVGEQLGRGGG